MFSGTIQSFVLAYQNIRSNLFHTFLSVLGIVIGVAALVATFSLIDGLEKFARDRISAKTTLNMLGVETKTEKTINGISVHKDTFEVIDYERFAKFRNNTPELTGSMLSCQFNREITVVEKRLPVGAIVQFVSETPHGDTSLVTGRFFSDSTCRLKEKTALVNEFFTRLAGDSSKIEAIIGNHLNLLGNEVVVIGVVKDNPGIPAPMVYAPISLLSSADLHKSPPEMMLQVGKTEQVPEMKKQAQAWIDREYGEKSSDFAINTHEFWVNETKQGFTIFRIIMGLIIGISVVVGGVGVMNVLLISVTERTQEIGLRKAVGARKSDVRRLFLAESITVSAFGSLMGLLIGAGFAKAVVPIIRFFVDVPFSAVLTWNTIVVISIMAVVVGIVFGTYPAIKAARLDPVEALRRE